MKRTPVVAGRFYPGSQQQWEAEVRQYLAASGPADKQPLLSMLPHAGYMFSGHVAGRTLADVQLADTVLLLGPNHSGRGEPLAVWSKGSWEIPGVELPVDQDLAERLLETHSALKSDFAAHDQEHSLEVLLPFLWVKNPGVRIVPICVSAMNSEILIEVGQHLARTCAQWSEAVSVIVSSDMSHFISGQEAKIQDDKAIQAILNLDPKGLFQTVRKNNISMCGVLPMTLGLALAVERGASRAELVQYANSGDVTGDRQQVVAYAGMRVF